MRRRDVQMRARARLAVGAALATGILPSCSPFADDRPNILIVMTDDQRADGTLGVMPETKRWIVDRGTIFERAFATTPQCCPSRASIFTGRYVHNHGVLNNDEGWAERIDESTTLHRYLAEAGYRTGLFGKFLNEWDLARDPRYLDEWSIYAGPLGYYEGGRWNVDGDVATIDEYYTSYIEDRALGFLGRAEEDDDRPWLLYLHPTAPHHPFLPHPRHAHADVGEWDQSPAVVGKGKLLHGRAPFMRALQSRLRVAKMERRAQLRTLMSVDEMVGTVMETLQEAGELDRTIVVFLSDNGYLWNELGVTGKSLPYLDSARIPLAVAWPGRFPEGVEDALVANIDLAPTLLDAAGRKIPDEVDGLSLLDVVEGRAGRDRLLLEHWGVDRPGKKIPPWTSLLTADEQYIEYHRKAGGDVIFREYYDLAADPWQLHNLLGDRDPANDPDVARLSEQLAGYRRCSAGSCP